MKDESINSTQKTTGVGIPTKTVSWAAILSFLTAYSYFVGYSYLKAKLEAVGFRGIDLNLSTQESLTYALEVLSTVITRVDLWSVLGEGYPTLVGALVGGSVIPFIFWLSNKFKETDKAERLSLEKFIAEKISSFKDAALYSIPFAVGAVLVGVLAFLLVVYCVMVFWLLAILGSFAGHSMGKELTLEPICKDAKWSEESPQRITGCNVIKIADGKELRGARLHQEGEIIFFVTNDGAYEIDGKGKIRMYAPFHEKKFKEAE